MLSDPKNSVEKYLNKNFMSIFTTFIVFELVRGTFTLPKEDLYKIDFVIKFHEKNENYELCEKLLTYKKNYV